jgi:SulP family sulfate permease
LILENLSHIPLYLLRPVRILQTWQRSNLGPDLIAGLTVGLIALPQAIAFALIAELPPAMGLYAIIVAAMVSALWGASRQLQTGPANAISLLVLSVLLTVAAPGTPEFIIAAGMLAVMAGAFQLIIGLARLGLLVNFVSHSVIVGFASGAAVLIAINQVRHLLGLTFLSHNLPETLQGLVFHLPNTHWPTALVGLGTIALLIILRKLNRKLPGPLIAMIIASGLVFLLHLDQTGVSVIGKLPNSLPPLVKLPLFNLNLLSKLATGALAVGAIGLIQTTAIARSMVTQTSERIDNNQEFVGQGLANIAAGFFSGYPGTASFARSAVNKEAGARSPLSAVFTGLVVLLAMLLLAPLAVYLPRAALSGVLIVIAARLIDRQEIALIWQGTPGDAVIMVVTFVGTLFLSMEFAILTGILLSFALYIMKTSAPQVYPVLPGGDYKHFAQQAPGRSPCPQLGIIKISGDLYFGAVNHIEEALLQHLADHRRQRFLLLRMHGVNNCDISGIHMLESIRQACQERGGDLFLMKVQPAVHSVMQATGFYNRLGANHLLAEDEAIPYLFYKILDPAVCTYECDVRIFRECRNLPKRSWPQEIAPLPVFPDDDVVEISAQELWRKLHNGPTTPLIIDTREPREFKRGHIPEAKLKPLPELLSSMDELPTDRQIVFVCQSGRRSRQAAHLWQSKNDSRAMILQGGMLAWETAALLEAIG